MLLKHRAETETGLSDASNRNRTLHLIFTRTMALAFAAANPQTAKRQKRKRVAEQHVDDGELEAR